MNTLDTNKTQPLPPTVIHQNEEKVKTPRLLTDVSKITKTARCAVKFTELLTDTRASKTLKMIMKSTKICKVLKIKSRAQMVPKRISCLRKASSVKAKAKALALVVKCTRATIAGTITLNNYLGISFIPSPLVDAFKMVNPFLKPASLYIALSSLAKTRKLQSKLQSSNAKILGATTPSEKRKVATEALEELLKLNPKRLQKKLCLSQELSIPKKIAQCQLVLSSSTKREDVDNTVQETSRIVSDLTSKAKTLLICKTMRVISKAGIITGNFLIFTEVAPTLGHILVYSSVFLTFTNWAIQKKLLPR